MWCHSVMAAVSSPAFLMAHWGVNVEQKKKGKRLELCYHSMV